jgi:hypothetical protein
VEYFGKVQGGKVVLDPGVTLPEGIKAPIELVKEPEEIDPAHRLGESAVDDPSAPTDMAAEHDHDLYGSPKRRDSEQA